MEEFNRLVSEQMVTMDQLLSLQSELERQQELKRQLSALVKEQEPDMFEKPELELVKNKITIIEQELKAIQNTFTRQTEELIRVYNENLLRV